MNHANHQGEPGDTGLERVRHLKRGTEYEVLGEAEVQIATARIVGEAPGKALLVEGDKLTIYQHDGKLWARFTDEFRDGRFETIASAPSPEAGAGKEETKGAPITQDEIVKLIAKTWLTAKGTSDEDAEEIAEPGELALISPEDHAACVEIADTLLHRFAQAAGEVR